MNFTLGAFAARLILVCVVGLVCQCSSPDVRVPVPSAQPMHFREDQLTARVKKLKRGDSMERCVSLLGEPTKRSRLYPKTSMELLGTNFYYVIRQKGSHLDAGTDRYLAIWFDATGHMARTNWYGQP